MVHLSLFLLSLFIFTSIAFECPTGWTPSSDKTKCFVVVQKEASFADAEVDCENRGGNLASVQSTKDNSLIRHGQDRLLWIGGQDAHSNGTWTWTDGADLKFTNWAAGEPSQFSDKNCVVMDAFTGLWEAVFCDEKFNLYVCEEVDPALNKCPKGAMCHNGYAYLFTPDQFDSWDSAAAYCRQTYKKGNLASIHDKVTDMVIRELVKNSCASNSFCEIMSLLGGRVDVQGDKSWSDGSPWDYPLTVLMDDGIAACMYIMYDDKGSAYDTSYNFSSDCSGRAICEVKI
ncbi:hypothetical protein QR680_010608 [Steinernema hermaphroditum]|uniref:C-type lectin domain-containing protein n=1 Tax=Steinernema hermaphroditum TaxID=289476 RepID=A0AA39MC34_9BILA|nr:hypothetical protein QR680_010608 [Steinernema hermaphroditum]